MAEYHSSSSEEEVRVAQPVQAPVVVEKSQYGLCNCGDYRCVVCNPPPIADAELGPPVYDPYYR